MYILVLFQEVPPLYRFKFFINGNIIKLLARNFCVLLVKTFLFKKTIQGKIMNIMFF